MKYLRIPFKILPILTILIISSCGPNRTELKNQAHLAISKDVINITNACFDQATLGIGGLITDLMISKSQKDSLILHPINSYIDIELNKKTEEELKILAINKKERMKLIFAIISNNREPIIKYTSEKIQFAKEFIKILSPYIETLLKQSIN